MDYAAMLALLKAQCALIPGVKTCKVGLEAEIMPDDYPIIRLVPSRLIPQEGGDRQRMELTIYHGAPLQAFDGLEAVYVELFRLETAIRDAVMFAAVASTPGLRVEFVDTITDEDWLTVYKLFASRFQVEG